MGSGIRLEGLESNGLAKQFALCSGFCEVLPSFGESLRLGDGGLGRRDHGLPRLCPRLVFLGLGRDGITPGKPTVIECGSEHGLVSGS